MKLRELVFDGIVIFVAIKGIKIYGDIREQIGALKGATAQAAYDKAMYDKEREEK